MGIDTNSRGSGKQGATVVITHRVREGTVVYLMVYVVMPRYTKLIQRWLFS